MTEEPRMVTVRVRVAPEAEDEFRKVMIAQFPDVEIVAERAAKEA